MSLIRLENLCKTYTMGAIDVPVLKGVNTSIGTGELLAIMGPSGSGKSTLMNILGCLDTPTSGRYLLDEEAVDAMTDNQLSELRARAIGFVFQQFHLLKYLSVLDNVKIPLEFLGLSDREADDRARQWLTRVHLEHRLDHLPHQLSGGERQRVAIARALVKSPRLVLADEPTGNLDEKVGREIVALFRELNRELGITIIIVTHSAELAAQTQRVINIRDGVAH
jgi:putative ABC transport system ATP-binding protein